MEFILEACVGICADGALSVVDSIKGLVSFVIQQIPNITATYCFVHRRGLLAKTLGSKLKEVSDQGVETVNFMKTRPACIFELLFESMDSQFEHLLLHTQVKWLSKGKILLHFFDKENKSTVIFLKYSNVNFGFQSWNTCLKCKMEMKIPRILTELKHSRKN